MLELLCSSHSLVSIEVGVSGISYHYPGVTVVYEVAGRNLVLLEMQNITTETVNEVTSESRYAVRSEPSETMLPSVAVEDSDVTHSDCSGDEEFTKHSRCIVKESENEVTGVATQHSGISGLWRTLDVAEAELQDLQDVMYEEGKQVGESRSAACSGPSEASLFVRDPVMVARDFSGHTDANYRDVAEDAVPVAGGTHHC